MEHKVHADEPTIRDHLQALGKTPEWIVSLGEAVQKVTDCSIAIAAARARDLSRALETGQGLEWFIRGWMALEVSDMSSLSPMQLETLRLVLEGVTQKIKARFG